MKREKTKHPNIFRDPRSGIYYYRKGKIEKSLKTDDFKIALQKVKILESTIDQLSPNAFKHRVGDLYPMYQENRQDQVKKEDLAKNSFEEMTALFRKHLLPHFEKMRLAEINERTWAKYGLDETLQSIEKSANQYLKDIKSTADRDKFLNMIPRICYWAKHERENPEIAQIRKIAFTAKKRWLCCDSQRLTRTLLYLKNRHGIKPDDLFQGICASSGITRFREYIKDVFDVEIYHV